MKIGLVQPVIGQIGGNDAVLDSLIKILKSNNHEVILYTFSKTDRFTNITVNSKVPFKIGVFGIYQKWLMPKIKYSECDLYISLTGSNIKTNKPLIIYDQNNLGLEMLNKNISPKYKSGFWKLYYLPYKIFNKVKVNKNAVYISNSIYSAKILEGILQGKVNVIYPGVPISDFYQKPKKNIICMIGRISPDKNLEFAVEVLNSLAFHSVIFGNVTKTNILYFNKLKKLAKPHVIITSGSREQLKDLLAESKVYFHTSKETFGISVVEAISSGCIPVVPNNSAHLETVPVEELRYTPENVDVAVSKLCNAINGMYDHRVDALMKYVYKFDSMIFEKEILDIVEVKNEGLKHE